MGCSHFFVVDLYWRILRYPEGFPAVKCANGSINDAINELCFQLTGVHMGNLKTYNMR